MHVSDVVFLDYWLPNLFSFFMHVFIPILLKIMFTHKKIPFTIVFLLVNYCKCKSNALS